MFLLTTNNCLKLKKSKLTNLFDLTEFEKTFEIKMLKTSYVFWWFWLPRSYAPVKKWSLFLKIYCLFTEIRLFTCLTKLNKIGPVDPIRTDNNIVQGPQMIPDVVLQLNIFTSFGVQLTTMIIWSQKEGKLLQKLSKFLQRSQHVWRVLMTFFSFCVILLGYINPCYKSSLRRNCYIICSNRLFSTF